MSPFGSRTSAGIPARSASSRRTIASPVLPEPVMPTMTPCVVRSLEPTTSSSAPGLPVAGSIALPRCERAPVGHGAECMTASRRVAGCSSTLRVEPGHAGRSSRSATPATSSGSRQGAGAERLAALARADRRSSSTASTPRAGTQRAARPPGARRLGQGRRHPRRVFEGVNPTGRARVASFKAPVGAELQHDYLWRIHAALPRARRDRHLQPLALRGRRRRADARARAGGGVAAPLRAHPRVRADARRRGNDDREGVPQRLARTSSAHGCRSGSTTRRSAGSSGASDLDVRARFDDYIAAYDEVIEQTSTEWAPWYVVPADRNWVKATRGRRAARRCARAHRPAAPRARGGLEGLRDRLARGRPRGSRDVGIAAVDSDAAVGGRDPRAGSSSRDPGGQPRGTRSTASCKIDFDVRREDGRCVEVVPGPAERVEPPGEDLGCLVDLELFELCRRHSLPPLERVVRCSRPSIAMALPSSIVPVDSSPAGRDVPSRSGGRGQAGR